MLCPLCEKEIDDDSSFCPFCGAQIDSAIPVGISLTQKSAQDNQTDENKATNKNKKPIVIAIIVLLVLAGIGAGVYAYLFHKAYEEAHQDVAIPLVVNLVDYDRHAGSGIPIQVNGTDLDGASVSNITVIEPEGSELILKRGSYTLTPAGPPVNDKGNLYDAQWISVDFNIDETGVHIPQGKQAIELTYESIAPELITDEQIQAALYWMTECDFDTSTLDALIGEVMKVRQVELDRIAEEKRIAEERRLEEERRKAEEEARRAEEEARLARRDRLTGKYGAPGKNAGYAGITSVSLGDGEISVEGELYNMAGEGLSASIGYKTWTFGIDDNTQFGFIADAEFHLWPLSDLMPHWAEANFPFMTIEVEDGLVKRMYQGA